MQTNTQTDKDWNSVKNLIPSERLQRERESERGTLKKEMGDREICSEEEEHDQKQKLYSQKEGEREREGLFSFFVSLIAYFVSLLHNFVFVPFGLCVLPDGNF